MASARIEETADQNGFDTDENGPKFLQTVTNTVSGTSAAPSRSGADGARPSRRGAPRRYAGADVAGTADVWGGSWFCTISSC